MLPLKTNIWFFSYKKYFFRSGSKISLSQLSIRINNNYTNFGLFLEHLKKRKEIEYSATI